MRRARALATAAAMLAASLVFAGNAARATVRASLDSDSVAPGDSVQLRLERGGRAAGDPDLAPLRRDFDILGTSRSSSIQIVNGNTSSSTEVIVTLSPKRSGRLTVPRIAWGGERTPALTLEVTSGGGAPAAGGAGPAPGTAKVFLTTDVDTKRPYVQAAARVTVRLYTREALYRAGLDFPASDDVLVQKIGSDRHGTAQRDGHTFQVVTRHYLVFPQRSGTLKLEGPVLSAEVATGQRGADPFFGNDPFKDFFGSSPFGAGLTSTRPIRLHGDPITIDVRPRPAGAAAGYWLPALRVELSGKWNPDTLHAQVGDPVTLDLHLEAEGLTAAQLPDLSKLLNLPAALKSYPDQAKLGNVPGEGTIVGSRDQSVAVIADRPGHFTIPALTLEWWDTKADAPREAQLPERELVILPAPGRSAMPPGSSPPGASPAGAGHPDAAGTTNERSAGVAAAGSTGTSSPAAAPRQGGAGAAAARSSTTTTTGGGPPWPWISAGAVLLWVATLAAWYLSRRRTGSPSPPRPATEARPARAPKGADPRTSFRAACRGNDARAARRSLLAWAAASWPESPPAGLSALAERLGDPGRAALLRELDRACYAGDGEWRGETFAAALGDLPKAAARKAAGGQSELKPLYP